MAWFHEGPLPPELVLWSNSLYKTALGKTMITQCNNIQDSHAHDEHVIKVVFQNSEKWMDYSIYCFGTSRSLPLYLTQKLQMHLQLNIINKYIGVGEYFHDLGFGGSLES